MSLTAQSPQPTLAWDFDGTTTPYIGSATATITGTASYTSGKYKQAISISNPGGTPVNYVVYDISPRVYQVNSGFSRTIWVKFTDLSTLPTFAIFEGVRTSTLSTGMYHYLDSSGRINSRFVDGTSTFNTITGPVAQLNTWYHLATVIFNGTMTYYVNGAVIGSASYTQTPAATVQYYTSIGARTTGDLPCIGANIDDLRIFNTDLTAAQVQAIYAAQGAPGSITTTYMVPSGPASITGNVISSNVYTAGRQPDTSVTGQTTYSNVGSYTFTNFGTNIPLTPTTTGLSVSTYFAYTAAPYGGEGLWSCRLTSNVNVAMFARQTGSSDTIFAAYNSNIAAQASNTINIPQVSGYTGNRAAWVAGRTDHIVFTFTNTVPVVGRMYVNGVLNASATSSNVYIPGDGSYTCYVPGNAFGSVDANMSVYDFRIVNGILSASQVAMLYRTLSGNNVPVPSPPIVFSKR